MLIPLFAEFRSGNPEMPEGLKLLLAYFFATVSINNYSGDLATPF
jgi:hypothetical protein